MMGAQDFSPRQRARQLRLNQTDAEGKLWTVLRARRLSGAKFRRQHPIGSYIVDFCCLEYALVIELDGGQHATQVEADQNRTIFLEQNGYTVLRFWNHEVLQNIEAVVTQITEALKNPHPGPLPRRAREPETQD
jgi:very-short-patch-repair endonuclease